MDWNELLQWSQKGFIACLALAVQLTLSLAAAQASREAKPLPVRHETDQGPASAPQSDRSLEKNQPHRKLN